MRKKKEDQKKRKEKVTKIVVIRTIEIKNKKIR